MVKSQQLLFIALLPPEEIQQTVTGMKQHFAEVYAASHALKSPPHITLQPPFKWQTEGLPRLKQTLQAFAQMQAPIPIILSGFGAFVPRVIFINVLKTPELLAVQKTLMTNLEATLGIVDQVGKTRPFAPHMTLASRDLTKPNFRLAWQEFQARELHYEFTVPHLTLLAHNGKHWEIESEFPFSGLNQV